MPRRDTASRVIDAPPQRVFAALVDRDALAAWLPPQGMAARFEALVASEPAKFLMPSRSSMRHRWVCVRLGAIDVDVLRELLVEAWRMCVPKKVAAAYEG